MKILTFAASTSSTSINKQLVSHAGRLATEALAASTVEHVDLNDYQAPIYSSDVEEADGIPEAATRLFAKIGEADALIISFAEHNGTYTAAFKNIFDWMSRIDVKVFQGKRAIYLATSPGPGGAARVLESAITSAPHFGAEVTASLSVPRFYENFDPAAGQLSDDSLQDQLATAVQALS